MKIDDSRSALRRYVLRRSPADHALQPDVPADCGPIHALLREPDPAAFTPLSPRIADQTDIEFIDSAWAAPEAACGLRVRVVYPTAFDTNQPDACRECSELAMMRQTDPEGYRRLVHVREKRRQARGDAERYLAAFSERQKRAFERRGQSPATER